MKDLIETFTQQLTEAISIGEKATFTPSKNEIRNIVITGLGGSGIGGSIVAQVTEKEIKVPVLVNKDYFLPEYVNENTLVIVSSYSGNTEETVSCFEMALKKNAKICCVTAGGKVLEMAKKNNCDYITIPSGRPPRSAFAYSFTQLLYVLHGYKLIGDGFKSQLKKTVALLDHEEEHIKSEAYYLAEKLHKKIPVIYSAANFEGVAIRFRQQVNENSKMLCWNSVLPEMNHNELVGWTVANKKLAVIFFRNEDDYSRTQSRMNLTKDVVAKYTPYVLEVFSKGDSMLEKTFYLVHFGDWVSWYLSEIRDIDATEVKVIDYLKGELAKG
ncbi:MAG TPA: bifunctional phosphoglucose/phosphomannose isomerase [Bacteroidia bacterium]|nr:bifunctional phosphoglucose/phosphomannose isomerase [Bacteroidia bacterium]